MQCRRFLFLAEVAVEVEVEAEASRAQRTGGAQEDLLLEERAVQQQQQIRHADHAHHQLRAAARRWAARSRLRTTETGTMRGARAHRHAGQTDKHCKEHRVRQVGGRTHTQRQLSRSIIFTTLLLVRFFSVFRIVYRIRFDSIRFDSKTYQITINSQ